ncbi:hypothetical protein HN011_003168, partial [Eciton burchellii]
AIAGGHRCEDIEDIFDGTVELERLEIVGYSRATAVLVSRFGWRHSSHVIAGSARRIITGNRRGAGRQSSSSARYTLGPSSEVGGRGIGKRGIDTSGSIHQIATYGLLAGLASYYAN